MRKKKKEEEEEEKKKKKKRKRGKGASCEGRGRDEEVRTMAQEVLVEGVVVGVSCGREIYRGESETCGGYS
jgi:hypothetical protein